MPQERFDIHDEGLPGPEERTDEEERLAGGPYKKRGREAVSREPSPLEQLIQKGGEDEDEGARAHQKSMEHESAAPDIEDFSGREDPDGELEQAEQEARDERQGITEKEIHPEEEVARANEEALPKRESISSGDKGLMTRKDMRLYPVKYGPSKKRIRVEKKRRKAKQSKEK